MIISLYTYCIHVVLYFEHKIIVLIDFPWNIATAAAAEVVLKSAQRSN